MKTILALIALTASVSTFAANPCQKFAFNKAMETCKQEFSSCENPKTKLVVNKN